MKSRNQAPEQTCSAADRVTRGILRRIEHVCWSAGTVAIASLLLASWFSARFQATEAKRLETLQQLPAPKKSAHSGDPIGKISIPRIRLSAIIAEGVDERTLRHAVGHFPESSIPEGSGTVALAGHRDTFFRGLADVRLHDLVMLETPHGSYQYQVVRTSVVAPGHVEVVRSSSQSDLTLVTCFPFYYIGPAPQRFIVQAVRVPTQ